MGKAAIREKRISMLKKEVRTIDSDLKKSRRLLNEIHTKHNDLKKEHTRLGNLCEEMAKESKTYRSATIQMLSNLHDRGVDLVVDGWGEADSKGHNVDSAIERYEQFVDEQEGGGSE